MDAVYDPWSTHVPALALAIATYGKRVLEIGAGWYSTPLVHTLSPEAVTIETDELWAGKFRKLFDRIRVTPDLMASVKELAEQKWDVVFIDCEGDHFRVWIADIFLDKPCCIVGHDSEAYYWQPVLARTRYVRHFDFIMPRTSWLSNSVDVTRA